MLERVYKNDCFGPGGAQRATSGRLTTNPPQTLNFISCVADIQIILQKCELWKLVLWTAFPLSRTSAFSGLVLGLSEVVRETKFRYKWCLPVTSNENTHSPTKVHDTTEVRAWSGPGWNWHFPELVQTNAAALSVRVLVDSHVPTLRVPSETPFRSSYTWLTCPRFSVFPCGSGQWVFFFKVALASKTDFPKSLIFVNLGRHKEENYLWSYHLEKTIVGIGKYLPRVFVCDLTVYLIRNTLYILFGTFPSFEFFNVYHVISLKHF